MFHVTTCSKFHTRTIRIVESEDMDKAMDGNMGECLLCGPCGHVEVGTRKQYWTVLSSHSDADDAATAAWDVVDNAPGSYCVSYLPKRPCAANC